MSLNSELLRLPDSDIWLWTSDGTVREITSPAGTILDDFELLPHNGLVPCPFDHTYDHLPFYLMLQSQILRSLYYTGNGKSTCMAAPENILRIKKKPPVLLGSLQTSPNMTMVVRHPYPYPPVEHGTTAIVLD